MAPKGEKKHVQSYTPSAFEVGPDNPIFSILDGERNRQADEWLRLGAEIGRLEQAIDRLERIVGEKQAMPIQKKSITSDAKTAVLEAFENW